MEKQVLFVEFKECKTARTTPKGGNNDSLERVTQPAQYRERERDISQYLLSFSGNMETFQRELSISKMEMHSQIRINYI